VRGERGARSKSFTVLDAFLILLAVLAVVGVWQRKNLQEMFSSSEAFEPYAVSFEVSGLRSTTVETLGEGTVLYDAESGNKIGVLPSAVAASAAKAYLERVDESGKVQTVKAVYPQDAHDYRLDVSGVLRCEGLMSDNGFLLGGNTYLTVGQEIAVMTEHADLTIRITAIEQVAK